MIGDSNDQSGRKPIWIPLVWPSMSPSGRSPKAVLAGTVVTFVGIVPAVELDPPAGAVALLEAAVAALPLPEDVVLAD